MAVFSFRGNEAIPMSDSIIRQRAMANSGAARVVLSPQWNPPPDPFKAYADQLRRDEARAQALAQAQAQALAQAERNKPLTLFGAPLAGPGGKAISNFVKGPLSDAVEGVSNFLTQDAPNFPVSTDATGKPIKFPEPLGSGVSPNRGIDRRGYIQRPVMDANGNIAGYEYVKIDDPVGTKTPTDSQSSSSTIDMSSNGSGNSNNFSMTADNLARQNGEDVGSIYSDNANTLSALVTDPNQNTKDLRKIQEQVWGEPTTTVLPNGDEIITYANDRLIFHGFDENAQLAGHIPSRNPNPIDPNATDAEKIAFAKKFKNIYVPPRYRLGQEYLDLSIMNKGEKIALQKNLRRAGYYPEGFQILPGEITNEEIGFLQAAMGEANMKGVKLEGLYDMREGMRKQAIAAERAAGSGGGGGGTTRSVDIRFDTTTMAAGRVLLNRILTDALGRSPSESELSQFMAMLNEAESKSPTKTITEYVNSGDTRRSTTRTTPSGLDPEAMAEDFAAGIDGGAPMTANKETDYLMGYLNSLGANA